MKSHWLLLILIALILALLGGVYLAGYRVGPGLSLLKTHTLTVDSLPAGALVYSDQAARGTAANGRISLTLTSGNHTLLASADGYIPWEEIVVVPENADATVHAFFIPNIPETVTAVLLSGSEAVSAMKLVDAATLPNASSTLAMAGGCALISVSNNRILASGVATGSCSVPPYLCTGNDCSSTILYAPVETLHSVVPYPGRTDALVIVVGTRLYAIELDPRTPRTFAPLINGIAPRLAEGADGTLFIEDAGKAYSLSL